MIYYVRGDVVEVNEDSVVIDVGGIGYLVNAPTSLTASLQRGARDVTVHTSHIVKDDGESLYGFGSGEDRDVFELLLTVSGIGPKAAVKLMSMERARLTDAIASEDVAILTTVPGIGPKTAKRVILELKDKVGKLYGGSGGYAPVPGVTGSEAGEAVQGLQALGYSGSEIRAMMKSIDADVLKSKDASSIISLCLKRDK